MTSRTFQHADRGQYVNSCPRCKTAPATQKAGCLCDPCYADVVQRALVAIRAAVIAALQAPERDCCEACGCLVHPDEHCPGCKARRQATNPDANGSRVMHNHNLEEPAA